MKTRRPVKITLTREEVFYCHRGRHPVRMSLKTGFTADGRIVGQHLRTALDGGAYGSYGVASTYYTGALQTVTYKLPAYRFDGLRPFAEYTVEFIAPAGYAITLQDQGTSDALDSDADPVSGRTIPIVLDPGDPCSVKQPHRSSPFRPQAV